MHRFLTVLLAAALAVAPAAAVAADHTDAPSTTNLGYRFSVDLPLTVGAAAFWFTTEAMKSRFAPAACRLCAPNGLDRAVRDGVVWDEPRSAQAASDVLLYGVAPMMAAATALTLSAVDDRFHQSGVDILLIAEATAVAAAMNQAVKFAVGRERPFAHVLADDAKALVDKPADNNLSFYSGHAATAFTLAAATATVAQMRGYRWAKWAWAVGMPIAAATAYLRMAGDKHYLSDVLTGAVLGTATGILVPALHDWEAWRSRPSAAFAPLPDGGGMLALAWGW